MKFSPLHYPKQSQAILEYIVKYPKDSITDIIRKLSSKSPEDFKYFNTGSSKSNYVLLDQQYRFLVDCGIINGTYDLNGHVDGINHYHPYYLTPFGKEVAAGKYSISEAVRSNAQKNFEGDHQLSKSLLRNKLFIAVAVLTLINLVLVAILFIIK